MMKNKIRRATRYPIIADIIEIDICTKSTPIKYLGVLQEEEISGIGAVVNLSTTGLCFTTSQEIELNVMLRCFLYMKKGKRLIKLRCEGPVVRTEKIIDNWQIAIKLTTLQW